MIRILYSLVEKFDIWTYGLNVTNLAYDGDRCGNDLFQTKYYK